MARLFATRSLLLLAAWSVALVLAAIMMVGEPQKGAQPNRFGRPLAPTRDAPHAVKQGAAISTTAGAGVLRSAAMAAATTRPTVHTYSAAGTLVSGNPREKSFSRWELPGGIATGGEGTLAILQRHPTNVEKPYCDSPPKPYHRFSGRCYTVKPERKPSDVDAPNPTTVQVAINHACYASHHRGVVAVLDFTDYVADLSMTPTVRNQSVKGFPVDPTSPEFAEQRAALPPRVPVPPYWSKVLALLTHTPQHDWVLWTDNDVWFVDPARSLRQYLDAVPPETFLITADVGNGAFAVRNSVAGLRWLQLWLDMGIKDGGSPCGHKWGAWEYHDLAFWYMANIVVLSEWSGVTSDCITKCSLQSAFVCYISFEQKIRRAGKWPAYAKVSSGVWADRPPPIAIAERNDEFGFSINLEWGSSKIRPAILFGALSVHSKSPLSSGLYSVGGVNQPVGFDFANCMRLQHNYCVTRRGCRVRAGSSGEMSAQCADEDIRGAAAAPSMKVQESISPGDGEALMKLGLIDHPNGISDGCSLPACECWNCSCQGATDRFGIAHNNAVSFGQAPVRVATWWLDQRCLTQIPSPGAMRIKLNKPTFDNRVCPALTRVGAVLDTAEDDKL
jgi:hypothetical protein